ncbi:MFS transporter [Micromonospora chersina]|uniref:MFS transporter n=1 Tax=Micromonospora chersina TaxID=47854 RepID=UPI00371D22F2
MVLVNTFGTGLFLTVSALYFTRVVGLSAGQVGLGLTAGGICGVVAAIPAGRAADRWGSRRVLIALYVTEAVGMTAYTQVHRFSSFLVLVCVETAIVEAAGTVVGVLYAEALPARTRVAGRAYLRAVANVAIGAGAAFASLALQADTQAAYVAVIVANAVTFVVAAAMLPWIPMAAGGKTAEAGQAVSGAPDARQTAGRHRPGRGALADLPFIGVTVLNALLALQFAILTVGLPLWIVQWTEAPRVMVAATMVLNTALVVVLQVRATRVTRDLRSAARACRVAGLLLGVACLAFGATHGLPGWTAVVVLVAGLVLQGVGEVLSQAGGWLLSYDLADPQATGAYQGVFNAGHVAALTLGPALITATAIAHDLAGWAALAAVFVLAGVSVPPAVRWATRERTCGLGDAVPTPASDVHAEPASQL